MLIDDQTEQPMSSVVSIAVQAKLADIQKIRNDVSLGKYDVVLSEAPSTPTSRQAEFMELVELVREGLLPVTPNIVKLIIKSSDISLKNEILSVLEQEMQQAQQQAQQEQMTKTLLGGK